MINLSTPKVRIILPTHNRSLLVSSAIESVLKQTYKNWELIVSNDGSTDNTKVILAEIAEKDSRIKILNNPNGGAARARNLAIEMPGMYEFIAFLDDDDQWLPHHLEHSCKFLQSAPNLALVCSRVETNDLTGAWTAEQIAAREDRMLKPVQFSTETLRAGWYKLDNNAWWKIIYRQVFSPPVPTVVIRPTAVSRTPWFDTSFEVYEDLEFWLYLASQGSSLGFIDSVHVILQYQGDNLTGGMLNLSSPILSRRYDSVLRYKKMVLQYCKETESRRMVLANIANTLYLQGQSYSEQLKILAARRCYRQSLTHSFGWLACKGYLFSLLPFPVWCWLKKLRSKSGGMV